MTQLEQSEDIMRRVYGELAYQCSRRQIPATDFALSLLPDDSWAVEYFTPVAGNCICYAETLAGVPDAIEEHIARVIERPPSGRVTRAPRPPEWKQAGNAGSFARKVKQRDGACVVCGSTDRLHAHHIKPRCQHPELADDPNNGVTLCRKHHREAHAAQPREVKP